MEIKIYNSISQIDESLWDSITEKDRIFCKYRYFLAVENSNINDCDYRYIMIFDDQRLIAHTSIFSISFFLDMFNTGFLKKLITLFRKYIYKNFLLLRVVECGSPTAIGSTITIADKTQKEQVFEVIIKEMVNFARQKKYKILVLRDFVEKELDFYNHFKAAKFHLIHNLPNVLIYNKWKSVKDYLFSMRSHYRYKLKKIRKELIDSDVEIEIVNSCKDIADRLHQLWFSVYEHAKEYQREILTPQFFLNMSEQLKEKTSIVLFKKKGAIVGFIYFLTDDYTLRPLYIGFDYLYNSQLKLYFNILCYEVIYGIENNFDIIEMGLTTIDLKKDYGAQVEPLFAFMKYLSPLKNALIPRLFTLFSNMPVTKEKHIFKT